MMPNGLDKLAELTATLPTFAVGHAKVGPRCEEYAVKRGTCFGWMLFADRARRIIVHNWFMSAGGELDAHSHDELELIFSYVGTWAFTYPDRTENRTVTIKPGEYIVHPCGERHSCSVNGDSWCIGITYPMSPCYQENARDTRAT